MKKSEKINTLRFMAFIKNYLIFVYLEPPDDTNNSRGGIEKLKQQDPFVSAK
tara:strand:+ start:244 stop:399 length:156 start_codon:yes stop_codon:yes gene_type:complete